MSSASPGGEPRRFDAPVLTIAIPTYNRSRYVRRLLASIVAQLAAHRDAVKVLVIDNCSPDDTQAAVAPFLRKGLPLAYVRNETNIGMDGNIRKCFMDADTEYVWIFGDDDVLLEGALGQVLAWIGAQRFALIHVGGYSFRGDFAPRRKYFLNLGPTRVTDRGDVLYCVNCLLTFISRNIVNKRAAQEMAPGSSFDAYLGSIINQLSFVFAALRSDLPCVILSRSLVGAQIENSGGYEPAEVFGRGMLAIVEREFPGEARLRQRFENEILEIHFPHQIASMRRSARFTTEGYLGKLRETFAHNFRFWLFCYPVAVLPLALAKPASLVVRAILKVKRIAAEITWYCVLPRHAQRSRFSALLFGSRP
ncbi:glycosyltransferase family 2 protein [Usitatibacter palustris]|uniref:Glycosyltransferase 2-like domain-containing protein n=1 Tax=Usitatibacter palustris TaxID=2732487 RepID=A0A6M4H7T0_9PROT|nr:glycosyltransferase family 2 protein [Usitatibacter palustris]QJR15676.1 hypothetical protein DSM104440_02501 [Usitatibacter palustris]